MDFIDNIRFQRRMYFSRRHIYLALVAIAMLILVIYKTHSNPGPARRGARLFLRSKKHSHQKHVYSPDMLHFAKQVNSDGNPVLVALINKAYLPLAYSWLCNTKDMGIHNQVLFITDSYSGKKLKKDWPDVHLILLSKMNELKSAQEYSKVGYTRLVVQRSKVVLSLLKEGVELLLFEVDCVWLANPIPKCQQNIRGFDIVAAAISDSPDMVAGGFLYMLPSKRMIKFWKKLCWRMRRLAKKIRRSPKNHPLSIGDNDQKYFNKLVREKYAGIRVNVLSLDVLSDGSWYKLSEEQQKSRNPLIINNNWIVGKQLKIRRAKRFGHWFWKEKSKTCDKELVRRIVSL